MVKSIRMSVWTTATLLFIVGGMAFALPARRHRTHGKSADLYIVNRAQVPGGPVLKSGDCRMTLLDNSTSPEIAFYENDKLMGKANGKLVSQAQAADHTIVHYNLNSQNDPVVTEIDVKGWTQKILFDQSS